MPPEIDEPRRETFELLAEAVHQISHDLRALRLLAERHAGILDGYQRGGLLGMRAARKQAAGDGRT
jgi:hypothetical protein